MKPWLICSSRNAVTTSECSIADGELPADERVSGFALSPILKPCCKPLIMCLTHSLLGWSCSALFQLGMSSGVATEVDVINAGVTAFGTCCIPNVCNLQNCRAWMGITDW